ncbi:MAG: EVE domain-containing protein [bacterium]
MANYWLMKSEPDVYSVEDLERDGQTHWDGVRNYQARNFMRDRMQVGDHVLYYHSNVKPPGVAGTARVVREAYPDHTSWDSNSKYFDPKSSPEAPRWFMVDIAFEERFQQIVTLDRIKQESALQEMVLVKRGRLSVQPVEKVEFDLIRKIGRSQID